MSLARSPTVFACGARIRNTIRWSGETSGETTLTGACIAGVGGALCGFASCARPTTAATEQAKAMAAIQNVRFISASPLPSWGTRAAWEAAAGRGPAPLWRFPATRFRRAEQRIDDGHVPDGVNERHRHFALATHGLREQVALNGVLVADRERFGLDAGAEQVGAVVHKDAARLVGRRVEWNLDLDPAAGSEQLHALIGNQLGGAGEDRLAGGEIEHGGSQAVRVHIGVAFQQGHHAARFLAEDEAGSVDGIAADIEQPSAAPRAHITDVGAVAIEIAEEAHDGAQFADAAAADQIAGAQPLRMRAHHESFAHLHAGAGLRFEQLAGFGGVESQRLLAEHVLSGLGRAHRPGHVQVIGQRVVDRLDFRIGQQFLVGTVGFRNAEGGGRLLGLRQVARGDGGDLAPLATLHGGYDLLHGYIGGAQDAPTDFAHHSISNVPRYSISEWFMRYWSRLAESRQ